MVLRIDRGREIVVDRDRRDALDTVAAAGDHRRAAGGRWGRENLRRSRPLACPGPPQRR